MSQNGPKVNSALSYLLYIYIYTHMSWITWLEQEESLICPSSADSSASTKPCVPIPKESPPRLERAHTPDPDGTVTQPAPPKHTLQTRDQISRFWQKSLDRNGGGFPAWGGQQVRAKDWGLEESRVYFHRCKGILPPSRQRYLWVCTGLASR